MTIQKGKPLVLRNGATVLPETDNSGSKVVTPEEQKEHAMTAALQTELTSMLADPFKNSAGTPVKRSLADVDVDFNHMNVVMLVVSYTIWGLDTFAISKLMNVSQDVVENMITTDLYQQKHGEMVEALNYANQATVHGFIQSHAHGAAKVVAMSLTSRKEENRLTAARDLLDRGGFRPADRVEHTMRFEDELRIRYVTDAKIPTLDLEPNHGNSDR